MRNSNIKIIFVDIDNTILRHHNNHHDFDKRSIKALNKAQEKYGVKLVIATARPYDSAVQTGVFNTIKPDAVIACNGTNAMVGDKVIYSDAFPKEIVDNVLETCNSLGIVVEISTPFNRYFSMPANEYVREYFKMFSETIPLVKEKCEDEDVNALLIFAPEEYDERLYAKLDKSITGLRFTKFGIDMHTHDVGKGDGVKAVLEYFGLKKDEAMSIGDSIGDISMFETTKFGVAMGNSREETKEKAYCTTWHIKHHGVKHALKKLKVI